MSFLQFDHRRDWPKAKFIPVTRAAQFVQQRAKADTLHPIVNRYAVTNRPACIAPASADSSDRIECKNHRAGWRMRGQWRSQVAKKSK